MCTHTFAEPVTAVCVWPSAGGAPGAASLIVATNDKGLTVLSPSAADEALVQVDAVKVQRRVSSLVVAHLPTPSTGVPCPPVLLVGDKVGAVTAYPLPALSAHKPKHLVEHFGSIVTAVAAVSSTALPAGAALPGQGFLLSADRDEKVRVSYWPSTFTVSGFCLGHTRFLSCLHVVGAALGSYAPSTLLMTGAGDGTVRLWHVPTCTLLHTLYFSGDGEARPSVGPHEDAAMADSGESRFGDEGGEGGEGGGKRARKGGAGAGEDEGAGEDGAEDEAGGGEGDGGAEGIPGTAIDMPSLALAPAMTPVAIVSLGSTPGGGLLFATLVARERRVRFLTLHLPSSPAPVSVHVRERAPRPTSLPQAILGQTGVLQLAHPSTSILAVGGDGLRPTLLVQGVTADQGGLVGVHSVHAFDVAVTAPHSAAASPSTAALPYLSSLNAALRRFGPQAGVEMSEANLGKLHGSMCTALLREVDKTQAGPKEAA